MDDAEDFDFRLRHPFGAILSGPSCSGKTYFVKTLMYNSHKMCSVKFDRYVFIYGCWQLIYDELMHMFDIKFIDGLPETLNDDSLFPDNKKTLLVIDDLMDHASSNHEFARLFMQYIHHKSISVLFLIQNLYFQGKGTRTISLNASYLIIFKNPRDKHQISFLG
ncbi:hypothetical protein [Enterococcus larvae]|uniref:hypothetical protein n=1 Tax=Enterococcus larvae TaxID=2794352 RepID=UPI003F3AE1DB